jgi:hypothetical protein
VAAAAEEALVEFDHAAEQLVFRSHHGLCSHAHAVSYEPNPRASCKPRADTPFFCEVTNQIAANQVDNGVRERWKMVPAVAEVFSPQSVHIHSPAPVRQQPPLPQLGQENPCGQRSPARYSRHATSSGNHDRNS